MHKFHALLVVGLVAFAAGCRSSAYNARVFHPWGLEDATDARARWDRYTNIFMVCIYTDHWDDLGPNRYSLHHSTGTVVKVYKGDWRISERIAFVQGLDYRALMETNKYAGSLGFVFTNEHKHGEFNLGTGEFGHYDAEYQPALECVYPQKSRR